MREYLIVSPIFPSGVAWLLNVLLELDLIIYRGKCDNFWYPTEAGFEMDSNQAKELMCWLPILARKRIFIMKEDIRFCWTHAWPSPGSTSLRKIFMVRDGRDAVYSQFKRQNGEETFLEYLQGPFHPVSGPSTSIPKLLPPADYWGLFCGLWRNMLTPEDFIITFEESKSNPVKIIKRLLKWIGTDRTDNEVARAIENSDFKKARSVEDSVVDKPLVTTGMRINRKGKVGEWKEIYSSAELATFEGLPAQVQREFGYQHSLVSLNDRVDFAENELYGSVGIELKQNKYDAAKAIIEERARIASKKEEMLEIGRGLACVALVDELLGPEASDTFACQQLSDLLSRTARIRSDLSQEVIAFFELARIGNTKAVDVMWNSIKDISVHQSVTAALKRVMEVNDS